MLGYTPLHSACWEIRPTSGRYASYWNAYLFFPKTARNYNKLIVHRTDPISKTWDCLQDLGRLKKLAQSTQEVRYNTWKLLSVKYRFTIFTVRERSCRKVMFSVVSVRPRSPDIPHMHASFLQCNVVPSATSDGNAPSERQNSVISGRQQLANGQKTVISANRKGSIKQTNTSQVLVSETVPDRRVQPSRRAKMTRFGDNPVASTVSIPPRRQPGRDTSTRNRRDFKLNVTDPDLLIPIKQTAVTKRHSDLREPQPSSSDSQPASSQPVSETTTSESSVSLPSSPSGSSSTESTSTSGTDSSSSETSFESSSQPSSNASSPETSSSASTSRSTSPELLEMERSFNSLLAGTRDRQSHPVTRSQMDNLRDQQQRIAVLKQVASQLQNQPRPVSAPPVANMPLPPYPRRRPSDKGSKSQVQAENANAPRKSSDSETDRLQDIQEEPRRRIGPSCVKEIGQVLHAYIR